ncbi:MAG: MGMT family protein [Campylobacterota bacterium]|nr:MGMT family protein [Campylobacterota bacterium]
MTFDERCYALLSQIPEGKVSTYKEIAHALGTKAYRAVGNAMNKNPYDKVTHPCHRVVKSDGTIGDYATGSEAKIKRLTSEGFIIKEGRLVDFSNLLMKASEFKI